MRCLIFILVALSLLGSAIAVPVDGARAEEVPVSPPCEDPPVYVDSAGLFSLSYACGWASITLQKGEPAFATSQDEASAPAVLGIGVSKAEPGLTTEDLPLVFQMSASRGVFADTIPDYELVSVEMVELGGMPMAKHLFTGTAKGDIRLSSVQYLLIYGGRMYVLTGASEEDKFADYEPIFDWMASTLELLPAASEAPKSPTAVPSVTPTPRPGRP